MSQGGSSTAREVTNHVIDLLGVFEVNIVLAIWEYMQRCIRDVLRKPVWMLREAERILGAMQHEGGAGNRAGLFHADVASCFDDSKPGIGG
mmetsp:Transcript_33706/g.108910  ORF Transcript_33706/g.108910 Transcript_33706/m.108910 type:complete len:91 (+) Transcript_33706:140-412(+)